MEVLGVSDASRIQLGQDSENLRCIDLEHERPRRSLTLWLWSLGRGEPDGTSGRGPRSAGGLCG